jgi:hypothetical protein
MSRLSSQGTIIMIESGTTPAGKAITAATKAKPCVLTVAAFAGAVGDIVMVRGTGWSTLDDRPFAVKASAAGSVTLEDSDTTTETAVLGAGALLESPPLVELCRSTFTLNQPAGATIDVTTLCDEAHRIVSGLPAIATWQAAGFYDFNDLAMWAARSLYRSGNFATFKVKFRDGSGLAFSGNVNAFDLTMGINAAGLR